MNVGDRIHLPISVQEFPNDKQELPNDKKECHCSEEEVTFIRSLELYKVHNFDLCCVHLSWLSCLQ